MKKTTQFKNSFSEEVWSTTYKDYSDEDVNATFKRVATAVASVEQTEDLKREWADNFYDMLSDFKCTAGGRIYANAGTDWAGTTLFNCFTAPRHSKDIDSLDNIIRNLKNQSFTLKSEGGWGENFSYIRPRGAFIKGIGVETPGAVKYMELFDKSSEIITAGSGKQSKNKQGKTKIRKGAQMAVLDVWHPDIVEFITAKQVPGRLTKFNISVNCSDEFMDRVVKLQSNTLSDEEYTELNKWDLRFPDTAFERYADEWDGNLASWESKGYPTIVYNTVEVTWLWNLITDSTYTRNEPGVLFLDRANENNPGYYFEHILETNPCGEIVLPPAGVCNLGSINLVQFVDPSTGKFDLPKIKKYVGYLVRFLDNINDLSNFPLDEYKQTAVTKRRVGMGVLGWGSALFMMKIRFGSPEAAAVREEVLKTIYQSAYMYSIDLAEEKGMFPLCDPIKHSEGTFVKRLALPSEYVEKMRRVGIRNSTLGAIAPNGNTSIFANIVSGGLEPIFMPEYIRTAIVPSTPDHIADVTPKWHEGEWAETSMFKKAKEGDEEILKGVDQYGVTYKIDRSRGLTKEVPCEDFSVSFLKERNEWDPTADWAKTTTELTVDDHVSDLAGFAKYIDQSCSKTINVPNDYPLEAFKQVYIDAYSSKYIKGVTTYRAGTMTSVLSAKEEQNAEQADEEIILDDVKLPDSAPATMKTLRADGKKWYVTVIYHEQNNRPFALFVKTNANQHEKTVLTSNAVELLIDLAKRKDIPEQYIIDTEAKIKNDDNASKVARCISLLLRHGVLIKNIVTTLDAVEDVYVGSFIFQIKKFLSSYIKDGETVEGETCQECGSTNVVYAEGCKRCQNCGSSKCG